MSEATSQAAAHRWKFSRVGGVDQVVLRDGSDVVDLEQLDQKLWVALAMPTRGVELDPRTADILDTDKDGRGDCSRTSARRMRTASRSRTSPTRPRSSPPPTSMATA